MTRVTAPRLSASNAESIGDTFRAAMRELASGVSIAAVGSGEARVGTTVTSVTSLSVEPPSLLVCIAKSSSLALALRERQGLSINVLSASQEALANRFAGRDGVSGEARFQVGNWSTGISGAPVLAGSLATFDCEVEDLIPRHTHLIVIGRVLSARVSNAAPSLTHWRGAYHSLAQRDGRMP